MKQVPNSREVDLVLKAAVKAVKGSLKGLNEYAGHLMAKGNYDDATSLAERGKEIQVFMAEIEMLRKRWKDVRSTGKRKIKKLTTTPLWEYYQPILKALVELGGKASRSKIEPIVKRFMESKFQPGDSDTMARGRIRWQVMIQRARKHLVSEDWLEAHTGSLLHITQSGRQAAKASTASMKKTN